MSDVLTLASHEVPDHPHAPVIAEQMKLVEGLLDRWVWQVYPTGDLTVVATLRSFGRTLRVWVQDGSVNFDVFCGRVPFDAHMLTWVLAENFFHDFKARATAPEDGFVAIYLTLNQGLESLDELARFVWAGFQASITWWGRIVQVRVLTPVESLTA